MNRLIELMAPAVLALALTLPRWLAVMGLVPAFSSRILGPTVRNSVAIALALPLLPGVYARLLEESPGYLAIVGLAAKEAAVGLVLGCVIAVPFWLFESAGTYIDNQRGANMQAINPAASADASVLGLLMQQSLTVLFIQIGLFPLLLAPVYASFAAWQPTEWLPALDRARLDIVVAQLAHTPRAALLLAGPGLICLGLIELGFALLSRWSPQVPAYSFALPVKTLAAILVVAASASIFFDAGEGELLRLPAVVRALIHPAGTAR